MSLHCECVPSRDLRLPLHLGDGTPDAAWTSRVSTRNLALLFAVPAAVLVSPRLLRMVIAQVV